MTNWKIFSILFGASIVGSIAVLPFLFLVQGSLLRQLSISMPEAIVLQVAQAALVSAIAVLLGLLFAKQVGLGIPILEAWVQRKSGKVVQKALVSALLVAVPLGLFAGFMIMVLDATLPLLVESTLTLSVGPATFSTSQLGPLPEQLGVLAITPEPWQGFLAALYGGINEEILLRLFAMSFLVWVFSLGFVKRKKNQAAAWAVWPAIVGASILFGLAHLPFAATLTALTPYIIVRSLLLNGAAGIIFGWLFWKKGLEAAMIAHFTADIFLFVILPVMA